MPKVAKPGTSAEHQRAYDANALKRVKKLLKAGKSFVGEDDIVLRIRDEHLESLRLQTSGQSAKPTLSAEEADSLVANLPTLPRSGYTLCAALSAPPASRQPTPPIPPDASDLHDSPQDTLPLTGLRRAPTPSPEPLLHPEPPSVPPASRPHHEDPSLSPTSSSDESAAPEILRHPKRVRTPTPPLPTQSLFEDDSDTDSGTISVARCVPSSLRPSAYT